MIKIRIWCDKKQQFKHMQFETMEDLEEYAVQELGHDKYDILSH